MKQLLVLALTLFAGLVFAQDQPALFSEADKAIAALEKEPLYKDSLKKVYVDRWTLSLVFGHRYIANSNKSTPDTTTFVDFNERKAFFGLEGGYFWNHRWQLTFGFDILILPAEQETSSISIGGPGGISVEGQGSGGGMIRLGIGVRYFFHQWNHTRLFVGSNLSRINAFAAGGEGGFTLQRGQFRQVEERTRVYNSLKLSVGVNHRFTPGFAIDLNGGYSISSNTDPVGGITSPGGVSTSLAAQIIIGSKKKEK